MDNPRLRGIVERFATAKQLADEEFLINIKYLSIIFY